MAEGIFIFRREGRGESAISSIPFQPPTSHHSIFLKRYPNEMKPERSLIWEGQSVGDVCSSEWEIGFHFEK